MSHCCLTDLNAAHIFLYSLISNQGYANQELMEGQYATPRIHRLMTPKLMTSRAVFMYIPKCTDATRAHSFIFVCDRFMNV